MRCNCGNKTKNSLYFCATCKYKYRNEQQPAVKAKRHSNKYPNFPEKAVVKTRKERNKTMRAALNNFN